jgi:hypothetical protein
MLLFDLIFDLFLAIVACLLTALLLNKKKQLSAETASSSKGT